jgi:hypothetical protein
VRTFIERWYSESVTYDVVFDDVTRQFDVVAGEIVVFSAGDFVEVLHWCMRPEAPLEISTANAIDISPPWEPEE